MSAFEDIGSLLHPTVLEGLRQGTPPVPCTVWHSDGTSETFNIDAYPFDTLDTVKQLIASRYKTPEYLPKFTFITLTFLRVPVLVSYNKIESVASADSDNSD